jgi:large subunit ribosomal protein L3
MPESSHPTRGSKGYSPRKRAHREVPSFDTWPDAEAGEPTIQGFAGYKAGMTHVLMIDFRPESTTSGQEVQEPVTVLEIPPMTVNGVRFYKDTPYGLETITEVWSPGADDDLRKRAPIPKDPDPSRIDDIDRDEVDEVRLLTSTQPDGVSGVGKTVPELMENRVAGGSVPDRIDLAEELLGDEYTFEETHDVGDMVDTAAVTKGKGFQGPVKRWGVKLQQHKNSANRRDAGNLGPFQPRFIRPQVPLGGQIGYHHRTEYNKRVLVTGEDGEEITPDGGFTEYGVVQNGFALLHGSVPGPKKRLVRTRDALRYNKDVDVDEPQIVYVSDTSDQGR